MILKNCRLADGSLVDVSFHDKIEKISDAGGIDSEGLDISGKLLLPGMIDVHVHFRDPGETRKETWLTGSRAAASGGVTTVLDMPNNKAPIDSQARLIKKRAKASHSIVNYGLYLAVTENNIDELNSLNPGFVKLYYGHTTGGGKPGSAEEIFKRLSKEILICVHAEDNSVIESNKEKYDVTKPEYHSLIRDNRAEYTAVHRLLELAERYGNRIHFCHISSKESLLLIRQAKKASSQITCETCPQYLMLDDTAYSRIGNLAKVNPALKSRHDQEVLWQFLREGMIDIISSDHAPHLIEEKEKPYIECPSGMPGVETSLPLMLNAVKEGKLSLQMLLKLFSENPARIFRLGNKCMIREGYDADLVVVDPDSEFKIASSRVISKAGWSPYDGYRGFGKVEMTFVNGDLAYDGRFHGSKGNEIVRDKEIR